MSHRRYPSNEANNNYDKGKRYRDGGDEGSSASQRRRTDYSHLNDRTQQHDRRKFEDGVREEVREREISSSRMNINSVLAVKVNGHSTTSMHGEENRSRNGDQNDAKKSSSPDIDYELQTEEEEAKLIEVRRRQRQALLQKHLSQKPSIQDSPNTSEAVTPVRDQIDLYVRSDVEVKTRSASPEDELKDEQGIFEIAKRQDDTNGSARIAIDSTEMSAADYDPDMDRALDEERAINLMGQGSRNGKDTREKREDTDSEYEEVEVEEDDDVEDMFALAEDKPIKKKIIRVKKDRKETKRPSTGNIEQAITGLLDNWDDADGYYKITLGERIGENGKYQVFANLGRGMFSSVVKARDVIDGEKEFAIKIIRSQETMYKAGIKEISILEKLASLDPDDKRHVIRLLGHFEHRNHLCMVFESLSMNLREVIKRFGKDVGLNLRAVRAYAHQMFLSLSLMRKAEIMHADIKPDNLLVNENKTVLKMCDLGSASNLTEMEITPYLVSRFYRAPEIILGLPYDCALDIWSIGCTLYEVFTGRILFPGKTNNHMLLLMQELKGKFSTKQIRKGRFSRMHFDENNHFMSREKDKSTGAEVMRKVSTFAISDLKMRMLPVNAAKTMSTSDFRLTNSFIDLLNRILDLDPARRLTPNQALQHPFFSG